MSAISMIIGGENVSTATTFAVLNPATGTIFAQAAAGDASHVDAAVAAARAAFPAWSSLSFADRQSALLSLADLIEQNAPELVELVTKESGKPVAGLNGVGAGMEVGGAVAWTRVTASLSLPVEILQDNESHRIEIHRKPLGVVGSITPWNWPLMIAIWHVMPALLAGNTVVLKPSEMTPVATARFVELANRVLPKGVLNLVLGAAGSAVGPAMTSHPGINKIVFTGSTVTGRKIMQAAAGNLKRLTLELGGNDAGIVLPDVDPKQIAPRLLGVTLHNNGQTCACLKRLYVHDSIYEELVAELARLAVNLVVGDGLDSATELGPLQNEAQRTIVRTLTDDARAKGARVLCGGKDRAGPGYFFEPTILADVAEGMRVVDEEQFGPVVPVIRYHDVEDALRRANDNPNGLGGSVWSSDTAQAAKLALRLESGSAWVNEHGALQPDAPFGGVKQSGVGVEFGRYGLEEYTSIQTLKIVKG